MGRRRCDEGLRLDARYFLGCGALVKAEAEKARAAELPHNPERWNVISRRVEDAKVAHSEARREYIDHLIACPICRSNRFSC